MFRYIKCDRCSNDEQGTVEDIIDNGVFFCHECARYCSPEVKKFATYEELMRYRKSLRGGHKGGKV